MLYEKSIINVIIDSINGDATKLVNEPYESFRKLNIAGIRMDFSVEPSGRRSCVMNILAEGITSEYIKAWKDYAPGKFMSRDYRKDTKSKIDSLSPYYSVKFEYNGKPMKVLLRYLLELEDDTNSAAAVETFLEKYGDMKIGDRYYTVIKICKDDGDSMGWQTPETNRIPNILNYNINEAVYENDSLK